MREPPPTIPLVLATDDRYATGLVVTVVSAIQNLSPGWRLAVHVLDSGLEEATRQQLERSLAAHLGTQHQLIFHPLDPASLADFPIHNAYLSVATYARLLIPQLLPQEAKVIYADTDIILNKNLAEVYQLDLQGQPFAACQDIRRTLGRSVDAAFYQSLGYDPQAPYLAAGFFVLDQAKYRELGLQQALETLLKRTDLQPKQEDQTILNALFYGRWFRLAPSWNRLVILYPHRPRIPYRTPVNYHAILEFKPWHYHETRKQPIVEQFYAYLHQTDWAQFRVDEKRYRYRASALAYAWRALRMSCTGLIYGLLSRLLGREMLRRA